MSSYERLQEAMTSKKLDPISIRLDPEVKAALERLAKADDRSLSGYINRVLKSHVDGLERKKERSSASR